MKNLDLYKILGVDKRASQKDIKTAYRRIAKERHPDVNMAPDAEERMKEINWAYEVLHDPEERRRYDYFQGVSEQHPPSEEQQPEKRQRKTPQQKEEERVKKERVKEQREKDKQEKKRQKEEQKEKERLERERLKEEEREKKQREKEKREKEIQEEKRQKEEQREKERREKERLKHEQQEKKRRENKRQEPEQQEFRERQQNQQEQEWNWIEQDQPGVWVLKRKQKERLDKEQQEQAKGRIWEKERQEEEQQKKEYPKYFSIKVSSEPSGAKVYLRGIFRGTTPTVIQPVPEGEITLELVREGFKTIKNVRNLSQDLPLHFNLSNKGDYSPDTLREQRENVPSPDSLCNTPTNISQSSTWFDKLCRIIYYIMYIIGIICCGIVISWFVIAFYLIFSTFAQAPIFSHP